MKKCSKKEWEEILNPMNYEALRDMTPLVDDNEELTSNEVFDAIVVWRGGLGNGYEARSIISEVYGVELG